MRINTNMDYSSLFNSLPKSNSGISGLASLTSEYKNISTGSYRSLANAYVKKMKAENAESKKKTSSTDSTTDNTTNKSDSTSTSSTKLDPKKMTSAERLQAAKDAAAKASEEKYKQVYGSTGSLSGNTGYSSLFNFEA